MSSSANFLLVLHKYYVHYRPNIRPNYSVKLAEYSVSADTTFCCIGRTLVCLQFFIFFPFRWACLMICTMWKVLIIIPKFIKNFIIKSTSYLSIFTPTWLCLQISNQRYLLVYTYFVSANSFSNDFCSIFQISDDNWQRNVITLMAPLFIHRVLVR